MDLNCFFEAVEEIAQRVFAGRNSDTYQNLSEIINTLST